MAKSARRILVVEDDPAIQHLLGEILGDEGYEVRLASDGQSAIEALHAWTPDLILLDVMMPGMDGPTFRRNQLELENGAAIPVVILTARRDAEETARNLDAAAIVLKPFEIDDLVGSIEASLERTTRSKSDAADG